MVGIVGIEVGVSGVKSGRVPVTLGLAHSCLIQGVS